MLKISFVVPIYNDEKYLPQCLESLCMQKDAEIEFILVDDGSTDNSLNICEDYEKKDSRIRVFHQPRKGGQMWPGIKDSKKQMGNGSASLTAMTG